MLRKKAMLRKKVRKQMEEERIPNRPTVNDFMIAKLQEFERWQNSESSWSSPKLSPHVIFKSCSSPSERKTAFELESRMSQSCFATRSRSPTSVEEAAVPRLSSQPHVAVPLSSPPSVEKVAVAAPRISSQPHAAAPPSLPSSMANVVAAATPGMSPLHIATEMRNAVPPPPHVAAVSSLPFSNAAVAPEMSQPHAAVISGSPHSFVAPLAAAGPQPMNPVSVQTHQTSYSAPLPIFHWMPSFSTAKTLEEYRQEAELQFISSSQFSSSSVASIVRNACFRQKIYILAYLKATQERIHQTMSTTLDAHLAEVSYLLSIGCPIQSIPILIRTMPVSVDYYEDFHIRLQGIYGRPVANPAFNAHGTIDFPLFF